MYRAQSPAPWKPSRWGVPWYRHDERRRDDRTECDRDDVGAALGVGGMATVYRARDVRHDRDVALKVLRPELGESLGRERMTAGPMALEEATRFASEAADALDYAHRQDIVHRDIKPENILLHEGHAVVADFGIGKALVAATEHTTMHTQVGITVGTPAYMSPEQAAGDAVDGRSDLFALGCVLFEMLTGEVACTGPTAPATIARRFVHTPPPVHTPRRRPNGARTPSAPLWCYPL